MSDNKRTILVVDDDPKIRRLLGRCLGGDGYKILEAETSAEVDVCLRDNEVDLITLDLQLGAENGLTIASRIREQSQIPIIMVTGKGDVIDKVVGLEVGADDYIAKPFHVREVQARVRSVIRRSEARIDAQELETSKTEKAEAPRYQFNDWVLDPSCYVLIAPDGHESELTTAEFNLLNLFVTTPKRVLSRDRIMDELHGHDWSPYDRTVDNQVARLRKKIEADPARPKLIKTVRGVGYIFAADIERI